MIIEVKTESKCGGLAKTKSAKVDFQHNTGIDIDRVVKNLLVTIEDKDTNESLNKESGKKYIQEVILSDLKSGGPISEQLNKN